MRDLLMRLDAFRRPQRFESVLRVREADFYYWPARREAGQIYAQSDYLRRCLAAARAVDAGAIVAQIAKSAQALGQRKNENVKMIMAGDINLSDALASRPHNLFYMQRLFCRFFVKDAIFSKKIYFVDWTLRTFLFAGCDISV